jgi:hypothetical protein
MTVENTDMEINTVDVLPLTDENFRTEGQHVQVKWVGSLYGENNNYTFSPAFEFVGLISVCAVVFLIIVLFIIVRRKRLPTIWKPFKKSVFWDRR